MCYHDIPTHCVHLLATLLRVIFQWWGGPPWAGRWGRVHFFWRRCKKMCNSFPSKYHDTLQFDEAIFSSPSNLFPKEGIGFTHEDEQGFQELETGDWKTEDLVVAVGIWRSVQRFCLCWILYDQSFSWNSNRPILIPTHGLLDMASPAAFSCYESFLIQRFTPVPRWVLQSGVVGDVLNMCVCVCVFFVLKSL